MFNKFVKKSSKFFAVLLTATLAFTPLSYAAAPTTFAELGALISDGTVTSQVIGLESNIEAETTDTTLGTQGAAELTIKGDNKAVSGAGSASGFEIGEGQSATVVDTTFEKFTKTGDGSVISNTNGKLLIENSKFTANSASGKGGAIYNTGTMTINNSEFSGNTASEVANDVYNDGELSFLNGTTTMDGGVTGTGRTVINGGTLVLGEEAVLEQSYLEIGEGSSFAINVSSISITAQDTNPEIKNNGSLTLSTGTVERFSSNITGTGATTINLGANVNMGSNSIEQSKLIVDEDSSLTAEIQNLKIQSTDNSGETPTTTAGTITNNGTITLVLDSDRYFDLNIVSDEDKDGVLVFEISDGVSGEAAATSRQDIKQSTITIGNKITYINLEDNTIETNYITGSKLQNDGKLVLNLSEAAGYGLDSLTGVGVSSITVTDEAQDETTIGIFGATIQQDKIEFYGDKTLRLDGSSEDSADLATIQADIYNYMKGDSLHLTNARQEGDFINTVDSVAYFEDGFSVSGTIYNNGGTLNIVSSGFVVENGITSDNQATAENILNIGDADNAAVVNSSTTISYQTITISSGSLIMNNMVGNDVADGSITNSSITVEADGLLSVNPEKLEDLTAPITNDGIIEYYGGGEGNDYVLNTSTITASDKGTLRINGNVQNDEAIGISKQNIEVLQTSTFTVNTNDMTDSKIANAGDLIFFGLSEMTNETEVTGLTDAESGETVYGNLSIDTELVNKAKIDQNDINVNIYLTNDEGGDINARGTLSNVLELDNKAAITAATLRNESGTGSIINESGATITATTKLFNMGTIDNTGSIAAENEEANALLENDENATIKNNQDGSISADSVTNKGAIVSSGSIKATEITNEAGATIENYVTGEGDEYQGGTIEATEITNSGTLISNASGVKALVSNTETGVYDVMGGTISYNVSGAASGGSVVNINDVVTVSAENFISQNEINIKEDATLILQEESSLKTSVLNIKNGATLDTQNEKTDDILVDGVTIEDGITWNWNLDLDLSAASGDKLTNVESNGKAVIKNIKLLSDDAYETPDIQISEGNIKAEIPEGAIFATQNNEYEITVDNREDSTWLKIKTLGYGGLPNAVFDGAASYSIVGEGVTDQVTKWLGDDNGEDVNYLKEDLTINGNNNILTSTTNVKGLETRSKMLTVQELAEFSGFDNAITVDNEDGELRVKGVTFKNNTGDAVITNNGTTTLNGVTFAEFDSEDLNPQNEASIDVANNGELVLTGNATTFNKGISGEGTTTIKGIAIDMGDGVLSQSRVEISDVEGSSLTVKVDNLKDSSSAATGLIMNHGELVLIGNTAADVEVASLETEIKGVGNTELQDKINVASNISQENINILENAEITVDDAASIKATTITVGDLAILTSNADNIITSTDGKIANEGIVEFTGGTNKNVIEGTRGSLYISGEVVNSTGTKIEQAYVEIQSNGGSLVANADDIKTTTTSGILNVGDLEFTGGTNENIIHGHAASGASGNLKISGDVINKDGMIIEQNSITINEGASLQANAYDLWINNGIANAGELVFVGSNMVNTSTITGTGNLTIDGDLENDQNITQTNIDILSGTVEHNVGEGDEMATITASNITISSGATLITHSQVVASEQITNDGTLKINVLKPAEDGGGADEISSSNNIIGKGDLVISSTVYTNDGGTISQKTLKIEDSDSGFETDIANLTISDGITNEGLFIYTGEGTNKNVIEGTGNLTIDGTIENSTGTAISQNAIAITEGNGFKTIADDITTTEGIENNGTLTFIGGTNNNEITMAEDGEGILIVENDLVNQANIEQKEINITGGDFENVRTSSITADSITVADGSTLITDALDLDISDSITITGEETVLNLKDEEAAEIAAAIMGAGKIVKEGEGTVTLSGDNAYTGTTTISKGAIEIVAESGISENTIYMDGGKLIINSADEVSFANEIMGTDHNDVNIEVAGSTTTLTGTIYGNKDLVKTGEGVLDLQMETNGYAGDTIISSGTVIGTTKNINGKVTGSGAEDSAVEFYDAEGEVTLNEIADMGSFSKTGEATMTVTENFKALDANITAGTFIINNDSEMGGSGNTFEVTNEMRVENASLQGYGDITAGDLIIGTGATFAPGNSTTTFKVNGNLIFKNDGEYDVEFGQFDMDTEGHYNDNTQVSGTTTIDPNAKITLNNLEGKYYVAETIDLINASSLADGFEYDEANVTFNDNDARDLREGYETRISTRVYTEGNALKIELQRKQSEYSEATEFDRSHNEQEVANAIDAISTGNGGDITNPLDAMEQLYYYESTYDIDGLKAALNDIGGVIHSNATNLTFFNTKAEHVYDKVKERTQDILPCKKSHSKVWGEYYYNNYSVDNDKNSPKHETSVNGFLVGYDMISAKNLTLGVTAGYGTSELKQTNDKARMNDINLGFYGGYETDKWLLKGLLLGGYEQYSIDRTIAFMDRTANSEHNGYSAALDLEVGYKISLNKKDSQSKHKIYLKPFIGAVGSYINNEGYEEKNADSLNLKIEDYSAMTAEARAGLELNGRVKKFGWYAKAGARQLLTDKQNEIESSLLDFKDETKMKIWSAENAQTTITGGIGVDYDLSENWNIFANGLGNFANVATNYYANVGLMYKFGCINNKKVTDEDVEKITAMLNDKITEEEALKKEIDEKDKELNDAKEREKELQNRIQKYEANVVSEQEAEKMKNKKIKTFKLGEKPTFVFGTDQLNNNGKTSLKQVATELENYPDAEVLVEGHTDNVGSDEVNQVISEKRASSVATSLKKDYGVRNNIAVIGKGKNEPIASNDTAEGRAQNRRVEITITTAD
ncbi:autotransporter domain-containing protein [Candidatus Ruminimicrobiellum ovillum]|uniref:autotransporter domain-containing protein n=1 Tax=Candidatus Ruminimicrobiellum ovillum TaxID=1947927 RepID=UPI00355A060B